MRSSWVKIVLGNTVPSENSESAKVLVAEQNPREEDANSKDPARDGERNCGLDLTRPTIVSDEDYGGIGVSGVDTDCDDGEPPEPDVGRYMPARLGTKVGEVLRMRVLARQPSSWDRWCCEEQRQTYNVGPFLVLLLDLRLVDLGNDIGVWLFLPKHDRGWGISKVQMKNKEIGLKAVSSSRRQQQPPIGRSHSVVK